MVEQPLRDAEKPFLCSTSPEINRIRGNDNLQDIGVTIHPVAKRVHLQTNTVSFPTKKHKELVNKIIKACTVTLEKAVCVF